MLGQCGAQISSVEWPVSRQTSGVLAARRVTFERDVLNHLQHRLHISSWSQCIGGS